MPVLNSKLFPFERNRYYLGKPLTSADFVSEQTYFNDKRRLLNRLIFDHGIVTGLSVFRIDELTISVDSGLAIDRSGREIVVPSLIAKKLSSIANFEKIKSEEMYLCLQYSERESQTGVNNSDNISGTANEHNRFEEGYELILRAPGELISEPEPISAFVFRKVLFDDGVLRVIQKYPKIGRVQDNILFKTVIENIGNEPLDIQLSYKMSAPGILGEDGGSQVTVDFGKIKLLPKKSMEKECRARILVEGERNISIHMLKEDFMLTVNEQKCEPGWDKQEELMVLTERSIFEEVCSSIQSESMQDIFAPMAEDYIVLAGIKIKRLGLEYQIEDVEKISPNRLAYSVAALKAYERIKGYYPAKDAGLGKINKKEQMQPNIVEDRNISKYMASGVVDIPIGLNASAGSIFFSDEIMHGLGRGAVGVTVAVEMYKDSGAALTPLSETIWGKMDIFDDKRRRNAINVETAVKVMYDRGTFMIGIRLLSWTDAISVSLRWTAFKAVDMEKRFLPFESKSASLTLVPDTIVLTPGETAVFQTVFTGMESGPCTFELVDDVGGTIDMNGEYVASAKEGVYEIRAVSVENPSVSASAFALVKQKKVKDVPGGKAKPFGF